MAARGSSSSGMIVLTSILGLSTLGLFVASVIFFAQARAAKQEAAASAAANQDYIRDTDRNNPVMQRLVGDAKKSGNKSAVAFMLEQQEGLMRRTLGTPSGSVEALDKALEGVAPDNKGASALTILKDQQQQINALKQQLTDAAAAKDRALADRENMAKLMGTLEEQQRQAAAKLTGEVEQTKTDADQLRTDVDKFKATMDERVDKIRQDYSSRESALQKEVDDLQRDRVIDRGVIEKLRAETKGAHFTGAPEQSLVDATIVGMNSADNTIVLGIGRKQRAVLGLTFEIYGDATGIRPDERTGEYPRGKASVELIRVDADSSVARVLREQKGNPVVTGDVAANALYDPNKVYTFLVFGNFDPTGSGIATPLGAADIKARIANWGGKVVDTLTGNVDFIVLGQRPQVPPEPASTAPFEIINEYLRLRDLAKKYDELFQQATQTSIPVLNENRLYTLTGS